jgi:hypothetical protein
VNAQTMGGRRSRHWCGPGSFRETKKALARGFIGQWSAPHFLLTGRRDFKSRSSGKNGFVFSNVRE